jgi:hypothetical protein
MAARLCYAGEMSIRVRVQVPADHLVKLPDEVPVGPVELIVFVPTVPQARSSLRVALARELLRTSPKQRSDSTALIREDRMR